MARECLSDMQVEQEIARLQESPYVKLANRERRVRERRRMYLYSLRQLEKKGKALEESGVKLGNWSNVYLTGGGVAFNRGGKDYLSVLTEISQAEGTQYSWRNAIVAECEGRVVGSVVGYDGAKLAEFREGTFAVLRNRVGRVPDIADETEAGEHYLDSLSVALQYQRLGIGRKLIDAFCQRAFSEGAERVGLIVDAENPNAERLYLSQGFTHVGERIFFNHQMHHLQRTKPR